MKKLVIAMLIATPTTHVFCSHRDGVQREADLTRSHDPIPQYMVANFFNILVSGAKAITAQDSETQIQATAEVLNSISNLAQLAMRSDKKRMSNAESDQIHKLAAKLYRALISNREFIQAIQTNREEVREQLEKLFEAKQELA